MKLTHREWDTAEWRKIRRRRLRIDKYTCVRCNEKFSPKQLTVHHVMPRSIGGSDDGTNLMTLCGPCHDYIEIHNLRTRAAIIGSLNENVPAPPMGWERPDDVMDNGDPVWYKWVYGGNRDHRRLSNPLSETL